MSKKFSYDKAMDELNGILTSIQNEEVGLDQLSELIKKANKLIHQCKDKLRSIDDELEQFTDSPE